jgi:hypothetical protein
MGGTLARHQAALALPVDLTKTPTCRDKGRYRHLFEPVRNEAVIQQIQVQIDRYWAEIADTAW